MKDFEKLFGEFLNERQQPKSFEDLVSVALDAATELQQQLRDVEKALLAMKANNSCENNIPLMTGAMEVAESGPKLLNAIGEVAAAHSHMHHKAEDDDGDVDIQVIGIGPGDLPPEVQAILARLMRRMRGR